MTRAISIDRWRVALVALFVLTAALVFVATTQLAPAADVMKEDRPMGEKAKPVGKNGRQERVVVTPEPPHWNGWSDRHPSQHGSAPRVHMWVDRGEWSTYYPGDRLWVYFRVDRPCFVTILDYSPDGRGEHHISEQVVRLYLRESRSQLQDSGESEILPQDRWYGRH